MSPNLHSIRTWAFSTETVVLFFARSRDIISGPTNASTPQSEDEVLQIIDKHPETSTRNNVPRVNVWEILSWINITFNVVQELLANAYSLHMPLYCLQIKSTFEDMVLTFSNSHK